MPSNQFSRTGTTVPVSEFFRSEVQERSAMVLSGADEMQAVKARKKPRISRKKMSNYFTEYCNATSIHGFRYLGEQDRSCLEKLWWLATILISLAICIFLIIETYKKWERSPVIVSFATKQTPIWQIPFPAVTICPETKAKAAQFNITKEHYYFSEMNANISKERKDKFEAISLICDVDSNNFETKRTDESVIKFMKEVAPSLTDIFRKCKWRGKLVNCTDFFTPILTDEGICYTFNMLDRSEIFKEDVWQFEDFLTSQYPSLGWSLENGYGSDLSKDSYPRRALYSGAKAGLDIEFKMEAKDLSYVCGEALQGFKILLHNPEACPRVSEQYFRLPLNQAVVAAVTPEIMTTSSALKHYDPLERLCYFPHEKDLRFYKDYSQLNCEMECLANFTLRKCGCVDFHMPRLAGTPICGAAKIDCMTWAASKLLSDEIDAKLKREEEEQQAANATTNLLPNIPLPNFTKKKKKIADMNDRDCNCLPSCLSLTYASETSQTDWKWWKQYTEIKYNDTISYNTREFLLAKLLMFFKDNQFVASERDELVNEADFLANCGGLLGLFTGFSFISLVEIIYFLSLRFICNIRKYGRKNWSGASP